MKSILVDHQQQADVESRKRSFDQRHKMECNKHGMELECVCEATPHGFTLASLHMAFIHCGKATKNCPYMSKCSTHTLTGIILFICLLPDTYTHADAAPDTPISTLTDMANILNWLIATPSVANADAVSAREHNTITSVHCQ